MATHIQTEAHKMQVIFMDFHGDCEFGDYKPTKHPNLRVVTWTYLNLIVVGPKDGDSHFWLKEKAIEDQKVPADKLPDGACIVTFGKITSWESKSLSIETPIELRLAIQTALEL